jgi:hypothetical protein
MPPTEFAHIVLKLTLPHFSLTVLLQIMALRSAPLFPHLPHPPYLYQYISAASDLYW